MSSKAHENEQALQSGWALRHIAVKKEKCNGRETPARHSCSGGAESVYQSYPAATVTYIFHHDVDDDCCANFVAGLYARNER